MKYLTGIFIALWYRPTGDTSANWISKIFSESHIVKPDNAIPSPQRECNVILYDVEDYIYKSTNLKLFNYMKASFSTQKKERKKQYMKALALQNQPLSTPSILWQ